MLNLLFIKSKIQFSESKSQLTQPTPVECVGCLSSQRYNFLKANHNQHYLDKFLGQVVYQVKDTIFWKQITTAATLVHTISELFIKSKIQFSESKSQQWGCKAVELNGCLSSQRYNFLKANHNLFNSINPLLTVVYQVKDTIFWKQITTMVIQLNKK